jgi:hypothetical protein
MDIVQRAKNICLSPDSEWQAIAAESTPPRDLLVSYVIPLAAIGAVAGFVGGSLVGQSLGFLGYYRMPLIAGVEAMVFKLIMAVVGVFLLSLIVNALAPTFGGEKNSAQALKVVAYSYTPAWIAGILLILPALGVLTVLAGLYGLYLLYLGLPRLMKAPESKAIAYTAVSVVCAIVLTVVIGAIGAAVVGAGVLGAGAFGAPRASSTRNVQFDKDSPLGKLQELGDKLEENNKKVDAAQKAGDQTAAAAAALNGLGILVGGGKHYDPIGIDALKPFVPEQFGGLHRTSSSAEKNGFAGIVVSTAKATYGDGAQKRITLEITDSGGASGLVGLAGWAGGIQGEKEDDRSVERTGKVNGRLVHERSSKVGGTNEYSVVLGDRFVVNVEGNGVELGQLKDATATLDLNKLEAMKDVGAQ